MKIITVVTIAKLIQAHIEKDENKFMKYANHIVDTYEENGDLNSAGIIRSVLNVDKNVLSYMLD